LNQSPHRHPSLPGYDSKLQRTIFFYPFFFICDPGDVGQLGEVSPSLPLPGPDLGFFNLMPTVIKQRGISVGP
jgi:hypothetical protein